MIEVVINDRLGKKVRIKCNEGEFIDWLSIYLFVSSSVFCFWFFDLIFSSFSFQSFRWYNRRLEEADCCSDRHSLRELGPQEVVQHLQGSHHTAGLWNSRWHESRALLSVRDSSLTLFLTFLHFLLFSCSFPCKINVQSFNISRYKLIGKTTLFSFVSNWKRYKNGIKTT